MPTEKVVSLDAGRPSRTDAWSDESPESLLAEMRDAAKPKLLGLPCARCRAYYDADLDACPLCGCKWRVSPTAGSRAILLRPQAA